MKYWPVPTTRAVVLAAAGLLPALCAVAFEPLAWVTVMFDTALLGLMVFDAKRAPRSEQLRAQRTIDEVISSGVRHAVKLTFEAAPDTGQRLRGEYRDVVAPGPMVEHNRQRFDFESSHVTQWFLTPRTRGDLELGDLFVRLEGPLGLMARPITLPMARTLKVYPDIRSMSRDAFSLARANDDSAKRTVKVRSEGREFESLREYRPGDDRRSIDWKATARRGRAIVRVHQPERNQTVLLLIDCGRHMAGEVRGRRKLDYAVDAALRLAKVSLDRGDQAGVMAFATSVKQWLPPRKGADQLRAVAQALYRVEAQLEESDANGALDLALARGARRSLVVLLTDLAGNESTAALFKRTLRLVPRHLPLIISMRDEALHQAATSLPETRQQALERMVASRLERQSNATVVRLREGGARVLRASPETFGAATVNEYLNIKSRGLL